MELRELAQILFALTKIYQEDGERLFIKLVHEITLKDLLS